ncbi:MAG: bifunctional UDP-N-acetylglucosamine diphosphorylase/glucosamine-1-phosphate N-acetyltransferase GlmU [Fusobacterium sp.]|uniref:bifunctional UDP-N-acetylglucosamine diphosphorylase/glucosamine-1-phosphate N-acetyltransferase GlmU n=1 Tax=Fusobacterium sp. TaxID=68766 RepID=UPI0026DB794B|nr:bifunctional UDP-N-acetylglucosamine diphosphorylase/glucosamine-1-phosphate N-acetyltransferase GlmU [Fusobacterium sp.]MDO4690012.1 bifunctional UDP-N-acetylglucosamine diphosphorylase/glucosamine-1-phosphate N-acetyltransferase GlmU [Fusobacterium sp.]
MALKAIIMAAGKGTRMKSNISKLMHIAHGKPIISRVIGALSQLEVEEKIFILGHKKEQVLNYFGDISYVVQEEQLGTGHAVMQAEKKLSGYKGDVLILNGDVPLLKAETLKKLYDLYLERKVDGIILTANFENPFSYGRVITEAGKVLGIVEEKDASEEQKKVKEVNAGVYIFKAEDLLNALSQINNKNEKGEYYLTDVVKILSGSGKEIISYSLEDSIEIQGVNSKVELALVSKILRDRKNKDLMEKGVILIDPATTYIDDEVEIGIDTVIYPNVIIQGKTEIGENNQILSNTRIIDSKIFNNIRIESSVVEESILEDGVTIGPFAHLRPKTHLKENVHIGNFVETKKSILEKGVKAGHLSYLGDSHIGEKTNIGAGTITCNYDGKNKFKTIIGKNVFIGSDTMLVAPVEIGDNALIGAGSVITKNVPSNALGVARGKQIIKEGWKK